MGFPDQIPEHPMVPEGLVGDVIDLEGRELRIIRAQQGQGASS